MRDLTETELELVSGGQAVTTPSPPDPDQGARLIGGPPPTYIVTPSANYAKQTIERGVGPVIIQ
jgi:hypothetical protein